ncbi:hypothetical protein GCM10023206_11130 [Acinetobacter puyangensis]|uniref:Transposase, Mutator family n=1 Tax=Acinetobacter puyangensis TaxID=1096779 RepID=A0A240EA24_9GAMM|nr:Transposase, Mutator family [Acinetobacter puyangensis]
MLALTKEFAKNLKTEADLNDSSKTLKKLTVETALNAELTEYLGFDKNSTRVGKNVRNGYTTKCLLIQNNVICHATKKRKIFPTDDSVRKVVYLAIMAASKKWTMPIQNWKAAMNRFSIMFEERVTKYF